MTFKVLAGEGEIIHRSIVRSAASEGVYNKKRANADTHESIVEKDTMIHPEKSCPREKTT